MTSPRACPRCGAEIAPHVLAGHCPQCLIRRTVLETSSPGASLPAAARSFGDFELLDEIARGGMGVVYRARQRGLNRLVALKMILAGEYASPEFVRRFRNEAAAAARLRHPNIVTIYEVGEHEGQHFFAMELVDGPNFAALVREGPLPARRAAAYVQVVAGAVAHAHAERVLHRDLKPSNILLDPFDQPRVTDFGLARQMDGVSDLTATGQTFGSPSFMSPEQVRGGNGQVTESSDIYSLGAVLYHLLAGRPPFQGETVPSVLRQVELEEPVSPRRLNPSVPVDLETICLKCLDKEPGRRYATAGELADELGQFLRGEPIRARPIGALAQVWRWCCRRPAVATLSASVLLLSLVVTVGSTIAAWRIAMARRAENAERHKSEQANRDLRLANDRLAGTVRVLELRRAEELFRAGASDMGVADLSAILRRDPSNRVAASRLVSALVHGNWALPAAPPMRHLQPVEAASFSPDGRQVLSVSRDHVARIWEAASGLLLGNLQHGDRILSARYSPDGLRIVTASVDGTARIWSSQDSRALTPPLAHGARVNWAEFSPDSRRVVTASADKLARVWDAETGGLQRELRGHSGQVFLARFSPDGEQVATAGEFGSVRLWSLASGALLFRLHNTPAAVTSMEYSADGRRLVWSGEDGAAQLWDPKSGLAAGSALIHNEHRQPVWRATFSPDSRLVLTAGQNGTARLWEAASGYPLNQRFTHDGGVTYGAFSFDGQMVVTASLDLSARLWDTRTGTPICQPLREHERTLQAEFSPDGRRLVTASYDWTAQVWDIQPRRSSPLELGSDRAVRSIVFSPDGKRLLTASLDGVARVFDAVTGRPSGDPMVHLAPLMSAQFSPDGARVITASSNGTALVMDAFNGRRLAGPLRHGNVVWSALFSPNGEQVATASADGTARVWNSVTGEPVTPPLQHEGEVVLVRFSPDGRRVVTASEDFSARVWDSHTGRPVGERLLHLDHLKWAEFSPDGEKLVTASSDNTACVWSVATSRPIASPLRHARIVERAVFSSDGRLVATASLDLTARVWDAVTGQALTEPLKHDSPVSRVCFSPDGRRILTGGRSGAVRLWDVETGLALTEWLNTGGSISDVCFDPTGQRIGAAARGGRVWVLPEPPMPVPGWFPGFAETVAGLRLEERGNVELVPRIELEQVTERLKGPFDLLRAGPGTNEFYARLGRWFLADPARRAQTPF